MLNKSLLSFINSFSDDSDYTDSSKAIGNPINDALKSLKNEKYASKYLDTKKDDVIERSSFDETVHRLKFNPFVEIFDGCDGVKAVVDFKNGEQSGFDVKSKDAAGENLLHSEKFFNIIPLVPLNCCDIMFEDAVNPLELSRYWKVMRKKISYRLLTRAGLVEHDDYEFLERGIFNLIILREEPKRTTISSMLFPDGLDDFKSIVNRMFDDGNGESNFIVVNAAVSEYPNEPVKRASEYSSISIKPMMVDISYLHSDYVSEELTMAERSLFIDKFITGLFYSLVIEHRIVTFDTNKIEETLRKMMCDIAFNQDYSDESHIEPLYITDETLGEYDENDSDDERDEYGEEDEE